MAVGKSHSSILKRISNAIVGSIELFFYRYGLAVATNPWRFICGCLVLVAISSFGLFTLKQEKNPMKLWIPPDSSFKHDTDWIMEQFKEGYRLHYLLVTAPNVMDPYVIEEAEKLRRNITSMESHNVTWESVCFRIPVLKKTSLFGGILGKRRKRSFFMDSLGDDDDLTSGLPFDPSLYLSGSSYCNLVSRLPTACLEINLGQLWKNHLDVITDLSDNDVVQAVNKTKISPVLGHPTNFVQLLGGVVKDDKGRIISAESLLSVWATYVNFSAVNIGETGNAAGTSDWATTENMIWESEFVRVLTEESENYRRSNSNISIYYEAGRSYGDISSESMFQDISKVVIGCCIMFLFVQLIIPQAYNVVEFRFWMGLVGLSCIGLAFIVAVGICSLIGVPYGPVHTSLPFLLLGIGVDDVFVIVSCWKNLPTSARKLSVEEQVAMTLRHAGVSITVTSVTDLIAFLVGSLTILPSLQSFCVYTALGIFIMYIFQATIFVAFWSMDEKRIQNKRNNLIWCVTHAQHKHQPKSHEDGLQQRAFHFAYSKFILTVPGKILVLLATVAFASVGLKGNIEITQKFEPEWFLPNSSYLLQYRNERNKFYPDVGRDAGVYFGRINYTEEFQNIHNLALKLSEQTKLLKNVHSWTYGFIKYAKKSEYVNLLERTVSEEDFNRIISRYLWSPNGARFQKNFRFDGKFVCGEPAPQIIMSSIDFTFKNFSGPEEHIPAMNKLKQMARDSNITSGDGFVSVWAKVFANWVSDEVIDRELYRNLGTALCCVMICTGILIVDLQICFWIFVCVLLTLINVGGYMFYWGLYIDVASCIAMVLAVGLCVDFAAHIGHTFLTFTGTRDERALNTVKYIGTAAFNGGLSTLIAMSLLITSDAYIFQTFFKIFLLVVVFGLFHGLVFLPVVLSIIGPDPYDKSHKTEENKDGEMTTFKPNEENSQFEDFNTNIIKR